MSKDKEKFISKAQDFQRRGQLDKAIKGYRDALELDKKDIRLYMRLGDLYAKKKDNQQAIDFYLRAANFLTKDGFYSRAVAVYKQILEIDDSRSDFLPTLADLYGKLGLNNEAMAQYQKIAQQLELEGKLKEAMEIIQRVLDMDPRNVIIATKLAELHMKSGNKEAGYKAFRQALNQLKEEGHYEQYVKLLEKFAKADPDNNENLKELAQIYIEHERWDRVYAVLARVHQNLPADPEPIGILADAALKAGKPEEAVKFLKELAAIHKGKGLKQRAKEAMRKVLSIRPDDPEALALVGTAGPIIDEPPPVEEFEEVIEGPIEELEEAEAEEEVVIESGPVEEEAKPKAGSLTSDPINEHLTEAGVYLKYGLRDKAIDHIRIVLKADPKNLKAHQRLKEIYLEAGETDKALSELEWIARAGLEVGDTVAANDATMEWLRLDPNNASARQLSARLAAAPAAKPAPGAKAAPPPEEIPVELEEEVALIEEPGEVIEVAVEEEEQVELAEEDEEAVAVEEDEDAVMIVDEGEVEEAIELEEPEPPAPPAKAPVKPAAPPAAAKPAPAPAKPVAPPVAAKPAPPPAPIKPAAPPPKPAPPAPVAAKPVPPPAALKPIVKPGDPYSDEIEEADFYLQQGLADEARKIYLFILAKDPTHKTSLAKLHELEAAQPEEVVIGEGATPDFTGAPAAPPGLEAFTEEEEEIAEEVEEPTAPVIPPEPAPAGPEPPAFSDADLAPAPEAMPEPPAMAEPAEPEPALGMDDLGADEPPPAPPFAPEMSAPEPPPFEPPPPMASPGFDLKAEVETEEQQPGWFTPPAPAPATDLFGEPAGEEGLFDLAAELEMDEEVSKPATGLGLGTSEEFSFEETLSAFKRGVAKTISEHDSSTHFDLGIAFKEMGLVNDSISEFFIASSDPARYADGMTMAALIMRENGDFARATETCRTALSSEGMKEHERAALFFELGQALEAQGDQGHALWALRQGQALDPERPVMPEILARLLGVVPVPLALGAPPTEPAPPAETPAAAAGSEPIPDAGPPPSRESTTWGKAALEPPAKPEGEKPEVKKKSQKKISYV
jgi:tetratricopeptide (TPR) repeat protein